MSSDQKEHDDLRALIDGCMKGHRRFQKLLYEQYYSYAMSICMRHGNSYENAVEIVNDGFLKVFTKLDMYNPKKSFKAWVRRIMVNSAIDHYRRELKHSSKHYDIAQINQASQSESAVDKMAYDEVILQIQRLSPSYRAVFNLYVFDGFKHEEIGQMLNISPGTSKSNLSRARSLLQRALRKYYKDELA